MSEVELAVKQNTRNLIRQWLSTLRIEPELPSITEWSKENRYLPEGTTERPGYFIPEFCSYGIEIQENFHPDSPVRICATLKVGSLGLRHGRLELLPRAVYRRYR